jgi:hypothetical protein
MFARQFDPSMFESGAAGFLGGMFGDSGRPYEDAMKQYRKWANRASGAQNPFYNAGVGAIGNFQDWLSGMKDPSKFIDNLMGKYQQSPWAKFQQQQAIRAGQNAGSASGLTSSTPLTQFMQQNAANISSKDMNQWLSNVLGINNQYGAGEQSLMQGGQNAANVLSNIFNEMGGRMGEAAYGRGAGRQQDLWNLLSGLGQMGMSFFM